MGLFDFVKEKAAELMSGAGDKVSELTGTELPQSADELADTATGLGDTATGAAQDLTGSANDAITDVTDPRGQQ
ncbi:hypothetical protein [Actinophytocola sp.]|jgi:hypothetical protein|uniref:hypothetical protein n=1 Tax=Actinophytocola sp. TaxID=1872138 RepID=UPI002ED9B3BF